VQIVEAISDERIASRQQLASLEDRLGGRLPDDYVAFLLRSNGGRADGSSFDFTDHTGETTSSRVAWFFGLSKDDSYGLEANLDDYAGRIPTGFCPIGCDPLGNALLLAVGAKDSGSVWFWDHEHEREDPDLSNMSRIASSFQAFIQALH
jgi:hypothetical protein